MSKLEDVFKTGSKEEFSKNDLIVNAFDDPKGIYLITSGFVKSYSLTESGNTSVQLIRSIGDIFPLIWGLGKINRDVYFGALSDVTVQRISLRDFQHASKDNPAIQKELQDKLLEVYLLLAERVRCLEQPNVKNRLLYCLNNLAERFGEDRPGEVILNLPVHHRDLADMINASREATSREFVKLQKEGALKYDDDGKIVINAQA
jgi:CRP-like cAMP-binding protein